MADTTKKAAAILSLVPLVTLAVTPGTAVLGPSETQQFRATVYGTSNTGVTWSVGPGIGEVSTTGLYTAPSTINAQATTTVIAQSVADPSISARTPITLQSAPQVRFSVGLGGLTSLSYNSQSYFYQGAFLIQDGIWRTPAGVSSNVRWLSPNSSIKAQETAIFSRFIIRASAISLL